MGDAELSAKKRPRDYSTFARYEDALTRAQGFVDALMAAEMVPVPECPGIRVLRNIPFLESGGSRGGNEEESNAVAVADTHDTTATCYEKAICGTCHIVVGKVTESVWNACLDEVNTKGARNRVCVVGTPGVGKTTTTAFLIRMLLGQNETVVYHIRTPKDTGWVYEFKPKSGTSDDASHRKFVAMVYPEIHYTDHMESLSHEKTFYVVDPSVSDGNCNPDLTFLPKTIIVASPDEKYWGSTQFTKRRGDVKGFLKIFPLWEMDELVAARKYMTIELSEEVVLERYRQVGGVPRNIFLSEREYRECLEQRDKDVQTLSGEQAELIVRNLVNLVDTKKESQPKSSIMGYKSTGPGFEKSIAVIISSAVNELVFSKHVMKLWRTLLLEGVDGGLLFESYTRVLIMKGTELEYREASGKKVKKRQRGVPVLRKKLGPCREIRLVSCPALAAINSANILFHSNDRQYELIDFIYKDEKGHYHAFQATIGNTHTAPLKFIKELEKKLVSAKDVSLYDLVPHDSYKDFLTAPVSSGREDECCTIYHVMVPDPAKELLGQSVGEKASTACANADDEASTGEIEPETKVR